MRGRRKESRREGVEWPKITLINKSNNCNLNLIELFDICQHFAGANCCNNVARVPQDAYRTSGSLYEYMCVCVCTFLATHFSHSVKHSRFHYKTKGTRDTHTHTKRARAARGCRGRRRRGVKRSTHKYRQLWQTFLPAGRGKRSVQRAEAKQTGDLLPQQQQQ